MGKPVSSENVQVSFVVTQFSQRDNSPWLRCDMTTSDETTARSLANDFVSLFVSFHNGSAFAHIHRIEWTMYDDDIVELSRTRIL